MLDEKKSNWIWKQEHVINVIIFFNDSKNIYSNNTLHMVKGFVQVIIFFEMYYSVDVLKQNNAGHNTLGL